MTDWAELSETTARVRKSRRHVRLAEILVLAITIAGVVYLGDSVIRGGLFSSSHTVTVELPSGGGLYPGSTATYRGNRVGLVKHVDLEGDHVRATVRLDGDVKVPVDTEAVVANLSAIGEQHLDFRPRVDHGPYLDDGDVVHLADTRVPLRFDTLLADVVDVARRIEPRDVRTITRELGEATDTSTDLKTIGHRANTTLALLARLQPTLHHLMEQAQAPLRTVDAKADELRTFASSVDDLSAELERSDGTIRGLVDEAVKAAPLVDRLLADITPTLGPLLDRSLTMATLANDRLPGLDHWLEWGPAQMFGMADSTRGRKGHVLLVPNPSKTCDYGTPNRSPLDPTRTPARTDAHCTVEDSLVQQRGAQHVPGPTR